MPDSEHQRVAAMHGDRAWRRWGPYLSERQWGTVREDYSEDGNAWDYVPHDHARSRTYRWSEDGLAGFSDDRQLICMALALWNGNDPILKERLYGLTNAEGNHGEDVKELYWYTDGVPSHASMRMLYKYPQAAFPYEALKSVNASRGLDEREYEIGDTGVFNEGRYFDVAVDYAKASPTDVLMSIRVTNRGPDAATIHVLPQVWCRNTWSWEEGAPRPILAAEPDGGISLGHPLLGQYHWYCDATDAPLLFCENETNGGRIFGQPQAGYWKDGINDAVIGGHTDTVNPAQQGTKAAAHVTMTLAPGETRLVRVRLRTEPLATPFADFDTIAAQRLAEADAYYAEVQRGITDPDKRLVQRQALAGMLWSKQFYGYDVWRWLVGDPGMPAPPVGRGKIRNGGWQHLATGNVDPTSGGDIMSMPDAWEYPWFAAWDLAFQAVTLALIDAEFAKAQMLLLTQPRMLHPNGQMPAYEWNFSDVNPPVHAWAALRIFAIDRKATGIADYDFLRRIFQKLLLNFTWWVNREDAEGNNLFEGGFLGLDNIGVFDMRQPLPGGGTLEQTDGTAWAAMFALGLMRIAIELTSVDPGYEDMASKFFEHFIYIADAIHGQVDGNAQGLWDEQDQFYYNMLLIPGADSEKLRIRSIAGILPILASAVLPLDFDRNLPSFAARARWFLTHRPDYAALVSDWDTPGPNGHRLLSLVRKHRLNAVLTRMLDEGEFLSPFGIRSVSKVHLANPYLFEYNGEQFTLKYEPGEGETRIYGGNSNWRGPVWMPINYLLIEVLRELDDFYGDQFTMPVPTEGGATLTLGGIAENLSERLQSLFLKDKNGGRPYIADDPLATHDPAFADLVQFNEYFHGDTGRGLGASHQTGWTGLIALLIAQTAKDQMPCHSPL